MNAKTKPPRRRKGKRRRCGLCERFVSRANYARHLRSCTRAVWSHI